MNTPEMEAPAQDAAASTAVPATLWRRVAAKWADNFVLVAINAVLLLAMLALEALGLPGLPLLVGCGAAIGLLSVLYFARYTSGGRQTWGYRLAGLRAERLDGSPVSMGRAACRVLLWNGFTGLIAVCGLGLLNFLPALWGERRTVHDRMTRSRVVKTTPGHPALWAVALVGLVLPFLVVKLLPLQANVVAGASMAPTLAGPTMPDYNDGDRILVTKLPYRVRDPRPGELVLFRATPASGAPAGVEYVKRCAGVPGDRLEVRLGKLYRNGSPVAEPFVHWTPPVPGETNYSYDTKIVDGKVYSRDYYEPGVPGEWTIGGKPLAAPEQQRIATAPPGPVPAGQYFMLGDNRLNSNDSHAWGFVPRANIFGKAMCIYWPPPHARSL